MKKICILDYGMGNIESLKNAIKKIGFEPSLFSIKSEKNSNFLIITGVGAFNVAMKIMPFFSMKPLNLEIIANYKKFIQRLIMYFKSREWLMIANTHQFAENIYLPKLIYIS